MKNKEKVREVLWELYAMGKSHGTLGSDLNRETGQSDIKIVNGRIDMALTAIEAEIQLHLNNTYQGVSDRAGLVAVIERLTQRVAEVEQEQDRARVFEAVALAYITKGGPINDLDKAMDWAAQDAEAIIKARDAFAKRLPKTEDK